MRERESLFNEYIVEVRRREKDDKQQKKEQVSDARLMSSINWKHCVVVVPRQWHTTNVFELKIAFFPF